MSKARSSGSVCSMCSDLFLEEGGPRPRGPVVGFVSKSLSAPKVREIPETESRTPVLCALIFWCRKYAWNSSFCHGNQGLTF